MIIVGHRLQEALKNHSEKNRWLVGWVGLGWVGWVGWSVGGWVGWLDECDNYGNLVVNYMSFKGFRQKLGSKRFGS